MFQSNLDYYMCLRILKKDWKEFESILTEFNDSIMDITYLRRINWKPSPDGEVWIYGLSRIIYFFSNPHLHSSVTLNKTLKWLDIKKNCVSIMNNSGPNRLKKKIVLFLKKNEHAKTEKQNISKSKRKEKFRSRTPY